LAPSRGTRARAMKSVKKMLGKGGGGGGGSGKGNEPAAWEDFSAFTNTAPIAPGGGGGGGGGRRHDAMAMGAGARASSIEDAEGPHPLTKAWAGRIKNAKVRAAFMDEPIAGYTSARDLKVLCGTWNTNGKSPPADLDVSRWLDASSRPDVVVVGFQEIVPLTAGKVLAVEDDKATREWEAIIERALNDAATTATTTAAAAAAPKNAAAFASDTSWQRAGQPPRTQTPQSAAGWTSFDSPGVSGGGGGWTSFDAPAFPGAAAAAAGRDRYIRLASKQLVGVYITVYVNASTAEHTRDVRVHTVSTGFNIGLNLGGFKTPDITLGNKGGAAVWMRVYSTPIVFICSHLSAGSKEGDAEKRSADFGEIVTKLSFPAPPSASSDGVAEKPAGVADAHAAVWLGDLNYRLNLPDDRVRAAIASGNCASLLGSDQLLLERAAGKAFVGWIEAPVTFPPTYKYRPGTNTYSGAGDAGAEDENGGGGENGDAGGARVKVSAKEEKKKRTPAWCDRILWRGRDIRQNSYARAELTQSDHKPVLAEFTIVARELQPERLQETLDSLRRRLDAEEAASQPRCTLENPQADFGDLKHGETKAISFRLVNSGDVPARWGFVPGGARGAAARAVAPPWLALAPTDGQLLPGEEVEIRASACVTNDTLRASASSPPGASGGGAADAMARGRGDGGGGGGGGGGPGMKSKPGEKSPARAGSIAEAARIAAARAVGAGLATPTAGGGVKFGAPCPSAPPPVVAAPADPLAAMFELPDQPSEALDAILILHIEGGRDFFLSVAGKYILGSNSGSPVAVGGGIGTFGGGGGGSPVSGGSYAPSTTPNLIDF